MPLIKRLAISITKRTDYYHFVKPLIYTHDYATQRLRLDIAQLFIQSVDQTVINHKLIKKISVVYVSL